jgi:hypothetical protein
LESQYRPSSLFSRKIYYKLRAEEEEFSPWLITKQFNLLWETRD